MAEANSTIVFPKPKEAVLEDRDAPNPGPGELLIRTRASLISTGTELTIFSGDFPPSSSWADYAQFPFVPGYSAVGDVAEIGSGVDQSWIGTRVASNAPHALFALAPTAPGLNQARRLHRADLTYEEAAFFAIAEIVMNGLRRARIEWGESVAIYGLGLLGQLAARLCRLLGARPVFAVDVAAPRLGLLPDDAGLIRINPENEDPAEIVSEHTANRGADVVIELTGNQSLIPGEFACLRDQGRFLVLSSPRGATEFDFHDLCNARSISIIGAHNASTPVRGELDLPWTHRRHTELFYNLVADKEIDLQPLISHRAPHTDAPTFYHQLLEDRSELMGVILQWPE
jgi:2-desacetyl-2-hydroxyethyl bacteriochlorophyllide A dehydrogenase